MIRHMLGDAYDLAGTARLLRLRQELADRFHEAFLAAEPDLCGWMPSAAREQGGRTTDRFSCSSAAG